MNLAILKNKFFIIAGPNVIESEEHVLKMAKSLKDIFSNYDVNFIFKTSIDKANRSSLNSYRGLGFEEGLRILKKVKEELNIPIITDIHESWQAKPVGEVVDIIQIPAFLCRQTDLLKAAAETGKIIHVKKGQMCSAEQMHKCKEKIIAFGNPNVILCERGNTFGYQDLVVDPRNLIWLKSDTNLVSMDITHCLQQPAQKHADGTVKAGGLREMIPHMGKLAIAMDIDGIFMEVHDSPDKSKCDAPTQWPLDKLEWLLDYLNIKSRINHNYSNFILNHQFFRNPCGENNIVNIILKLVKIYKNTIIIDGGFNKGDWSSNIIKKTSDNIKIIGFEINTLITDNVNINDDRLILINKGLSDKKEMVSLHLSLNNSESLTINNVDTQDKNAKIYNIELNSLDNILKEYKYNNLIVKLDIESYEYKALLGLKENMEKILILQFEYHNFHKGNKKLKEYINLLKNFDFTTYIIGEYELLNITDNWVDGFDICNENPNIEPVNKRPLYKGGTPAYKKINTPHEKFFRPENINLIAIKNNLKDFVIENYNK